jgi:A/G-specific adenine glycosylase
MRMRRGSTVATMQDALLSFYRAHGRDLLWRRTRDPYAIWLSEVMLQQTQVATVESRYPDLLRRFPDVRTLARAQEQSVCEAWAGLGYYRRACNLHKAAVVVATRLGGRLPDNEAAWKQLPGIGDYTAAAIASIAFGVRTPAVDGNVVRVVARLFRLPGRASDPELVRRVRQRAEQLVDCDHPGDVNQALMDLGATLCRSKAPVCAACPLCRRCGAGRAGDAAAFPGKRVRAPRQVLRVAFAWIERRRALLLEQRPLEGLWAGLWELPSASGPGAKRKLGRRIGVKLGRPVARVEHQLTHRQVIARVYRAGAHERQGRCWRDPLAAPLSALARKAIVAMGSPRGTE